MARFFRLAALAACLIAGATDSKAAIFRLQSSVPDTTPNYNYGALTFTAGGTPYEVTGEFRVETDYLDASGATISGSGALQAWNIVIRNTNTSDTYNYVFGQPNLLNTSSIGAATNDSFTLACNSPACGGIGGSFSLPFANTFNGSIGNSLNTALPIANAVDSISSRAITFETGTTGPMTASSQAGQADFVPFSPGFLLLVPVASLLNRARKIGSIAKAP